MFCRLLTIAKRTPVETAKASLVPHTATAMLLQTNKPDQVGFMHSCALQCIAECRPCTVPCMLDNWSQPIHQDFTPPAVASTNSNGSEERQGPGGQLDLIIKQCSNLGMAAADNTNAQHKNWLTPVNSVLHG